MPGYVRSLEGVGFSCTLAENTDVAIVAMITWTRGW
jgi:hypothetical protein